MRLRATGRAAVGDVWERYALPAKWPSWSPQIRKVSTSRERIAPGMKGEVTSFFGITVHFLVESVDETRRQWAWRVRLGPVRLRLRHSVHAEEDGRVTTGLRIEGPFPAVIAYACLVQPALHRLVRP
ncbi:SRPBCC family protein [Streptomyces sp. NPDC017993]|uniref:SRPBCC family protein n=1 Tax=Streptomyces sp. NPDC017993 TaxID=3365027 RepID=UPI003799ED70